MDAAIWNVLHDGRITSAAGAIPGNLRLTVDIGYLCDLLPTKSKQLTVEIRGCEHFEYRPFDASPVFGLPEIAALGLEILSATAEGKSIIVQCADGSYGGELCLKCLQALAATLEGQSITQTELESAADRYWEAWSRRNNVV